LFCSFVVFIGFVKGPSDDFPATHGPQLQLIHNLKNLQGTSSKFWP